MEMYLQAEAEYHRRQGMADKAWKQRSMLSEQQFKWLENQHSCFILKMSQVPGGAEPNDTFQIWIFHQRDSLSWLAGRGTVEERRPFHKVSRNGALERATMFGTVISCFGDIAWSARSPELTVPNFFLWGFLKDCVFRRRIMTIQELKQAHVDEVAAVDEDLLRRVYGNFQTRLQQCIDVNRGYLPDVIFRK